MNAFDKATVIMFCLLKLLLRFSFSILCTKKSQHFTFYRIFDYGHEGGGGKGGGGGGRSGRSIL